MMSMSGILAVLRIVGAIALWQRKMRGLTLLIINCIVTLTLMDFLLPAGIADGLPSGIVLILILRGWFGSRLIEEFVS
ncbi:hypothetical protein [Salinibacterium sp. PAMC 21357]|uniref:hypothetical protein n=1 Tax=Salinibacterium sp. PAMC 21357 TaxID=1112215 RepID=UPI000289CA62|nr:hypothetical protein [Salinibacterium sp. PAMC 21357]